MACYRLLLTSILVVAASGESLVRQEGRGQDDGLKAVPAAPHTDWLMQAHVSANGEVVSHIAGVPNRQHKSELSSVPSSRSLAEEGEKQDPDAGATGDTPAPAPAPPEGDAPAPADTPPAAAAEPTPAPAPEPAPAGDAPAGDDAGGDAGAGDDAPADSPAGDDAGGSGGDF
mmetsp:Transcript_23479/g.54784  ORF Transcript_23479/g.54784 Transcript_23479/m.54784 type:complete len:172 (-) Transcript_23479:88-603(-)